MRRVLLTLAILAVLGLTTSTALAGPSSHNDKETHVQFSLASHHGHHGHDGHHGHHGRPGRHWDHHRHGHHHGYHHRHHPWHHGYGAIIIPPPVYHQPAVIVPYPVYPRAYHYDPRPHGSLGIYGRKFGFSIDF